MAQTLLTVLLALSSLGLAGAGALILFGDRAFAARLSARTALAGPAADLPAPAASSLGPALLRTLVRWGETAGRGGIEGDKRAALRLRLIQAGFYSDKAVEAFFGIRAAVAAGLTLLAILAVAMLHIHGLLMVVMTVMLAANIGLFLPNLLLSRRIAQRAQAVYFGLPDAIDLMVVSLEAGATLGAALQRVEAEFGELHPVLTEQFGVMLMEMQAGASRADALARLGLRSPSEEMKSLTTMIIQSEAVGASLGDTLRVFAEELRKTRFLDAERKAAELPVKLSFPLVFFIFPCLVDAIFVPVLIRFLRSGLVHS